jgi:hypothetical protein
MGVVNIDVLMMTADFTNKAMAWAEGPHISLL